MSSIKNLIRQDLLDFKPYSSARSEEKVGRIWLNANELPWNNSIAFNKNILNRYPEQQAAILNKKLAKYYEINSDQLLITRGSDEGIDLLVRLFCASGKDSILYCPPTFGMYEVCAKLQGANIIQVPLIGKNFNLNINGILSQWNSAVKLIFLCSPNNPTGILLSLKDIIFLCEKFSRNTIIVLDEAYIEFAKIKSMSGYINKFSNLVILRTLSKAFGLAAIRIGTLLANFEIISWLKKILHPYPISSLSTEIACKALSLENIKSIKNKIELITKEREILSEALIKLKITEKVWPSQSNFIFVKFKKPIYQECFRSGIVIRNMEQKTNIQNAVRITVGTKNENIKLIKILSKL